MTKLSAEKEIDIVRMSASVRSEAPVARKVVGARKLAASAQALAGNTDKLVKLAYAGDRDADAALCFAALRLIGKGQSLSGRLKLYIHDILFDRWAEGGYNRRNADQHRDFLIMYSVHDLIKRGWLPTRNRATQDTESACSIVQKGFALAGQNLSESRVEDIWREQTKWWDPEV
jgi:hypothetical protein